MGIPAAKKRPNVLWKLKLLNSKTVLLKPMRWLLREAVTPWLNSKEESVRWKWNWEEANEMAVKGGRNAMAKLEGRIREMEMELGGVQSKTSETYKSYQKSERRIKELMFQRDED